MMSRITPAHRRVAAAVVALFAANLITAGTADAAAAADPPDREPLRTDEPVQVTALESGGSRFVDPSADQVWRAGAADPVLPDPGRTEFRFDGSARTSGAAEQAVSLRAPSQHPAMRTYRETTGTAVVEIAEPAEAEAAGISGLLLRVSGSGSGPVDLRVDYSSFADLYGGGWGSRLRLLELPACAMTTPREDGCLSVAPVAGSENSVGRQVLSASLDLGEVGQVAGGRVFAVVATASGEEGGDYRATDLSPAGSWTAGGGDGAFTYSYPLRMPPSAGPVPSVALGYSSASHDGRTSGRNGQASWVGDGWGYEPGFIERSYKSCSLDDGGNTPDVTGDQCWDDDGTSVTLSLNGVNSTLVRDDGSGVWRAESDSNWRIELLGSPASGSGGTSERWTVTTTDGTRYFFASEVSSSGSRLTVPVFGNHSGEPCRSAAFEDSSCRQAYRWLLDKVVDVHGNMVRYFYERETGHYGAAGDPDNRVAYHRSGRLERIEYGLRAGDSSVPATGRVLFSAADRCLSNCGSASDPNESNWPDTPWDLDCDSAPCTSQHSPVFFSSDRLVEVRTQVREGSGFRDVDSWSLEHEFKDYGDEEQVTLWLKSIRHAGKVGGSVSLPKVTFAGEALPNRVDAAPGVPAMWRWRMSSIKTEAGAVVTVTYADPQCSPGNLPSQKHSNSMRCYPVRWTPEFFRDPIEDWFHKHVVASVVETDTTGGMPAVETYYQYSTSGGGTSALWAFDDSEFTEDEHRTYGVWRGYPQVTTRVGDPAGVQTRTRSRFYRGMDGQPLPSGGTRSVSVTDAEGNTALDHEALAGSVWEKLAYNGSTVISGNTYEYWTRRTATQARDHDGGDLKAWLSGVSVEKTRQRLTSTAWQRTETRNTFDSEGRLIRVNSLGDSARSGDEYCERTEYADSDTTWIRNAVIRSETVAVGCGATPSRPADVVSDTLTYFDGSNTHGATPAKGLPTRVDVLDDWDGGPVYVTIGRTGYDALGRVTSTTDAFGETSTVDYTPAGPGPVTQTVSTNPLGHTSTTELDPAWGLPTGTVEPNGRRTDLAYDALGRLTDVWLPARNSATMTASLRFEYLVRDTAPSAVISRRLNAHQDYVTTVVLYDSLLRERQRQTETHDRGRLVNEIVYDTHGWVEEEFGPNHNLDPPGTTIVRVREDDSARRFEYLYDAAGRVTDEIFYNKHVERWRTTTSYGGSTAGFLTTVQPPAGAPATATLADARGQTAEKRTYRANTPTGSFDTLSYDYSPTGRLEAMTDQAGNEWSWDYDLRGQVVAAHDPDAGTTTMAYDIAGRLVETTDARGEVLRLGYDELGRQVSRRDGDGTLLAEWEYDTAPGGIGMLAKSTRWADGNAYVNETLRVNTQGLVTQSAVTVPESEGPLAGQYIFTQAYTWDGQVANQGLPALGNLERAALMWNYDHVGNPTELRYHGWNTGPRRIVEQATFTPYNEIMKRTLGDSSGQPAFHGFQYEEGTRRLERFTFDRTASINNVADLRYTYDHAGNLLSVADQPTDLPANHELQCFQYDPQRRLVEAWAQTDTTGCATTPSTGVLGGPAPYWHSYTHDTTGNRTSETLRAPDQPTQTRTYEYPNPGTSQPHALQQVTTGGATQTAYTYDQAGGAITRHIDGTLQTLTRDTEGNITTIQEDGKDPIRMVYDADGNRIIRDNGDTVTAYLPQTELTHHTQTGTLTGTRYFTHAGHIVATCTGSDIADWVYHGTDQHGTTTTHTINAFTAVEHVRRMDPYGNPRGPAPQTWPGQQGFVGGIQDPTGLTHIGARSYDPTTGRFISIDPILDLTDNQQINGYAYANNNPTTYTDPTGLKTTLDTEGTQTYNDHDGQVHDTGWSSGNGTGSTAGPPKGQKVPEVVLCYQTSGLHSEDCPQIVLQQIGGLFRGFVEQWWESGVASWQTIFDYTSCLAHYGQSMCNRMMIESIAEDPSQLWRSVWDPIADDWNNGNYGEAIGRGGFEVVNLIFGGKGATKGLRLFAKPDFCSFAGDTLVLMADGSTKPIADIQPGDQVLAADPETGEEGPRNVTAVWVHSDTLIDLELNDGTIAITTTEDHPFWNRTDQQWQPASALDPDDELLTPEGGGITVTGLDWTTSHTDAAYNLTVADLHTYYVIAGDTPILVHNSGGCLPPLRGWQSQRFQFGNQQFLLDKKGMEHILTRHHPNHWDGSVKARQTFFDSSMSVTDVQGAIGDVMRQNRVTLAQRGSNLDL